MSACHARHTDENAGREQTTRRERTVVRILLSAWCLRPQVFANDAVEVPASWLKGNPNFEGVFAMKTVGLSGEKLGRGTRHLLPLKVSSLAASLVVAAC